MKLNIGAGEKHIEGYVSVDILPGADVVMDVEKDAWPWEENSIDEIVAEHFIEHIHDFIGFMNKSHAVLKPGAILSIVTPHPMCDYFWQDPTHIRGYTPNTFLLYCTGIAGTVHAGIIPWIDCKCWMRDEEINGVLARIIFAVLKK